MEIILVDFDSQKDTLNLPIAGLCKDWHISRVMVRIGNTKQLSERIQEAQVLIVTCAPGVLSGDFRKVMKLAHSQIVPVIVYSFGCPDLERLVAADFCVYNKDGLIAELALVAAWLRSLPRSSSWAQSITRLKRNYQLEVDFSETNNQCIMVKRTNSGKRRMVVVRSHVWLSRTMLNSEAEDFEKYCRRFINVLQLALLSLNKKAPQEAQTAIERPLHLIKVLSWPQCLVLLCKTFRQLQQEEDAT